MPMPPPRDHRITLDAAATLTRRFRQGDPNAPRAGLFPRDVFERILAQPGCQGIRIYYGRDANGQPSLVLVGVNADGNDMTAGEIDEFHFPCPPYCDTSGSTLNS
jgi:hypothetical protein